VRKTLQQVSLPEQRQVTIAGAVQCTRSRSD
jgi:hypothetical protein